LKEFEREKRVKGKIMTQNNDVDYRGIFEMQKQATDLYINRIKKLEQENARLVLVMKAILYNREVLGWDSIKYLIEQALPKNKE